MIQYVLTLLLVLFVAGFYRFHYKPKKQLQWYKDTLQALGYKVKSFPYNLLKSSSFNQYTMQEKIHSDPFYNYKNENFKYDILLYNTLSAPTLQFQNQQLIKAFFQPQNVYLHEKMKLITQNIKRSFGNGVLLSQGKQWKTKRGIMNAVFNYDFIIQNIPKISRICDENIKMKEEQCIKNGKYTNQYQNKTYKMNLYDLYASTFSNVILECFFGAKSMHQKVNGEPIQTFLNKLNVDIIKQNFDPPVLLFGSKFAQLGLRKKDRDINLRLQLWKQSATKMIKKRLAQLEQHGPRQKYQDIIQALILKKNFKANQASKNVKIGQEEAEHYDFKELIDQFCTFFIAGTQTTSKFTQMMIYNISKRKDIEQKLRSQINQVIKTDEDLTKQNLKKLTYIDWIQNETRRHYGPGNGIFTRIAQKDHYIFNIPIRKGTALAIQPTSSHYDQKYFKNPKQFRPQRWQSQANINNLMGFGGGPRTCIGKHLALLDSKIALVKFMRRYKQFKLPKQQFKMCFKFGYVPEQMEITLIPFEN